MKKIVLFFILVKSLYAENFNDVTKALEKDDYKNAYNQYKNEITLPLHTKLSNEDIEYIIEKFSYLIKKGES